MFISYMPMIFFFNYYFKMRKCDILFMKFHHYDDYTISLLEVFALLLQKYVTIVL